MTEKSNISGYMKSPLAKRLIIYLILFSASITLILTSLHIYTDYQRDLSSIDSQLKQIREVHIHSLSESLWATNQNELQLQIDGITKLPNISSAFIKNNGATIVKAGKTTVKNSITRHYQINYQFLGVQQNIGTLTVVATLDAIYENLIRESISILINNTIRTFLVVAFIFFLFHHLVTRHLSKIATFAENININTLDSTFKFDRDNTPSQHPDELDKLREAILNMQKSLLTATTVLKEREQNLAVTLASIGDAVITTDANGLITRMNPIAEKLTGWKFIDAKNLPLSTVFPIINATTGLPINNPITKILETGKTVYFDDQTTLISKDGTKYKISNSIAPILDDNIIIGMVLVFKDDTERYFLHEAAAKHKQNLQAIMDHSPAVIYVKDTDGNFTFINHQFEKLFHIDRNSIIGKTLFDIFPKDIAKTMSQNDKMVIRAGYAIESEEIAPQDDGLHTYSSIKFPIYDKENNIYAVCGISSDITDRKHQEDMLRRSQKMDALGKLTGGIAHDYNNLLGIIAGYAEQLNDRLDHEPELNKYSHNILYAAQRGAKLTKKLLAFSRNKVSDAKILDINKLLIEQQHMLEKTLTVRIALSLNLEENLWPVWLDSGDLEDAIINISINAMHAIKGNGQLNFHTHNEQFDDTSAKRLHMDAGDYVVITITDTGCGMDEATKERIFDPFYSTKGEQGTGLGMSQVYGFIERSNGTINVESQLGQGSCFTLYFPRCFASKVIAKTDMPEGIHKPSHEKILLVDDETALVELAKDILSSHGYQVLTAQNGKTALSLLKKEQIDLVVTDVIMPEMDGYELVRQIHLLYPHIKIQMMSGFLGDYRNDDISTDLHKNLLNKPYSEKELLSSVRYALEREHPTSKPDNLSGRKILIMDDENDMLEIFRLNLSKFGCIMIPSHDGDEALACYQQSLNDKKPIDIVILDLTIPGGPGGREIAKKILALDPNATLIVMSGDENSPEMTQYQKYGFKAALKKNYTRQIFKQTLEQVLSTN